MCHNWACGRAARAQELTPRLQVQKGLSVHSWPAGHATDMEEAIKCAQLHEIGCLIEKFPLEKASEAYGECAVIVFAFGSSLIPPHGRRYAQWQGSLQISHYFRLSRKSSFTRMKHVVTPTEELVYA